MTYRLWYIITWPSAITMSILLLDVVFTDLGRLENALDARETWLCICAYTMQNAIKYSSNCRIIKSLQLHAFVERNMTLSFCSVFLVILKNAVN
jgi:putative membrane protein